MDPLLPIGTPVRERLFCVLDSRTACRLLHLRQTLTRVAGRRVDTTEALTALAGWYLAAYAPQRRDVVIYQRSPESRVPGIPLAPTLAALPSVTDRLRAAFRHLRATLEEPGEARRSWERLQRTGNSQRSTVNVRRPRVPLDFRNGSRWRDGEVCIVPGCRTALAVQYDHGRELSRGGHADVVWDHRLCGPCNRAKYRGEIGVEPLPDGSARVTDRWGTPVGTPSTLGLALDLPLLTRLWALGVADVLTSSTYALPSAVPVPVPVPGSPLPLTG